jgi:excisionase family DNA binding protein
MNSGVRLALTRAEAAKSLGMSVDSFERHVQAELRLIRRGRLRLVPIVELERWLSANAARTLEN